jgi:hypothetical protein
MNAKGPLPLDCDLGSSTSRLVGTAGLVVGNRSPFKPSARPRGERGQELSAKNPDLIQNLGSVSHAWPTL